MKIAATSALLWLAAQPGHGFAPLAPRLSTRTSPAPSIVQHRMVMDKPDPMNIFDAEVSSLDNALVESNKKISTNNPTPVFVDFFQKSLNNSQKATMNMMFTAAAAALAMVLAFMPLPSDAAMSGGRMGGSYSRAAPSRSMSVPRSSGSYNQGFSRGYTSGYYSRPSVAVTPGIGFGYSPFISPFSPFGGGYYGGAGVISYSRGPSFFDLIFFGGLALAATSFVRNAASSATSSPMSSPFSGFGSSVTSALGSGTSVVQLSVAIEVPNRDDPNSILNVMNRLSRTAKTDSRVGIQNLTSQVALELLRRRSSIVSASSYYQHFSDSNRARRDYENRAITERSKFEKETVSRYGGVDYSPSGSSPSTSSLVVDGKATMAVITLVVAIDGDSTKIPTSINSVAEVEEALRKIASDAKVDDCLQSVEILWTPEDRSETLSMRDVIADYPELRSV